MTGGSEVYRIQKDGFAERIWNSPTDIVYAVAFDARASPAWYRQQRHRLSEWTPINSRPNC